MKMGTTFSPWRYDAVARDALESAATACDFALRLDSCRADPPGINEMCHFRTSKPP
jgi:hypothetical protein